jgi:prophage regulatory protein
MSNPSVSRRSQPVSAPAPLRFISLTEVCNRTSYSRWWLRDAINAGKFPKPVRTDGRSLFVEHEVEAWIAERIAERDAGAAA